MERNKYLEAMFHTSGHGVWIDHRGNANATLGKDAGGNGRPHNLQRQWAVSGVDLGHSASLQHVVVQKALEQLATTEAAARGCMGDTGAAALGGADVIGAAGTGGEAPKDTAAHGSAGEATTRSLWPHMVVQAMVAP